MKMKLSLFLMMFLCLSKAYAQEIPTPAQIDDEIRNQLYSGGQPRVDRLKDSVEFYGFAITIEVTRKGKHTAVSSISVNDSIAYVIYNDFNFLKKINYYSLIKDKKLATIVIPVGIMIAYVNYPVSPVPMVKAEEAMNKIVKMFNYNYKIPEKRASGFIYLNAIMCICSTKVYD